MSSMRAPRSRLVALLLACVWLVPLIVTSAAAKSVPASGRVVAQAVDVMSDGTVQLAADAQSAPEIYGSFRAFGLYDSPLTTFSKASNRIQVRYQRQASADSAVRVDVRGRRSDGLWSEWQLDVASGATLTFARPIRAAQYRAVLLSNDDSRPSVGVVSLSAQRSDRRAMAGAAAAVAPTYRLRVTRQGMVGGRTANGHIITENDVFVSLPSGRALSSLGGNEYQVRLSANGRSIVAPVYDIGPWNTRDDYWNANRERYRDLPVGWPEDHAAYFEGYNGGDAEKGNVRYPTAVDIGDGAYWALGLDGAQATVNVTFLWLGKDPGANAQPLNTHPSKRPSGQPAAAEPTATPTPSPTPEPTPPPAPEPVIEIDDAGQAFRSEGVGWDLAKGDCAYQGQTHWVTSTDEGNATDQAIWRPSLRGGSYDLFVYVPMCGTSAPHSRQAQYVIVHAKGSTVVPVDQARVTGTWIRLGRFDFAPGAQGYVQLRNTTGTDNTSVWADALRWVPVAP